MEVLGDDEDEPEQGGERVQHVDDEDEAENAADVGQRDVPEPLPPAGPVEPRGVVARQEPNGDVTPAKTVPKLTLLLNLLPLLLTSTIMMIPSTRI